MNMTARPRNLSEDDRIVWAHVAQGVRPLPGKTVPRIVPQDAASNLADHEPPARPAIALAANGKPRTPQDHPQHGMDRVTRRKIAKGRLPIDARIDLHGLTQTDAHALLFSFLHRAQAEGCRLVLVITGKGASFGSDGILRRAVPAWLQTPSFRAMVSVFDEAARGHGGSGAIYLRLRHKGPAR
jgi:DNA-nicking Smr family endonuclease